MARFRFRKLTLASAVFIPVVAGGFLLQSKQAPGGPQLLSQVMQLVSGKFVDTLADSVLYEKAAAGLVHQLNDPYTELLTPVDLKSFNTRIGGHYAGLGMLIENQNGVITVSKVYPNTPAERAGAREGDQIVKVDTLSTDKWSLAQVSNYLTGTAGTHVSVRFTRPGVPTPIDINFQRAVITVPAVPYTLMLSGTVGYVPLQTFSENAADETAAAVKKLVAGGATGIVLDLRRNPGGILDQSIDIASIFLKAGQQIASVRGRSAETENYTAKGDPAAPSIPLIVLTDPGTASAAEIVTGGLQDHDRALVIGQPSYGKGLVQSVYNLAGGYALKITTAKWYTPSGRSIQRPRKVVDDQFVEEPPDSTETDSSKKSRPAFKSDAGRTVYGGGGITPDLIVSDDTLTKPELQFAKAVAPKTQDFYLVLYAYSLELSKHVQPSFQILPAWRDELFNRLQAKGVVSDRKLYDSAERYIDRSLEQQVARFAFGDSTAKRRDLPFDAPLRKAVDMLAKGQSQSALFAMLSPVKR
jgi:carboxyl-terminal processing protease